MVAEFASRKLSAVMVDTCNQTETEQQKNLALVEPVGQASAMTGVEDFLDSSLLVEEDYQHFWAAFQEMMDSLDDDLTDADLTDAADAITGNLLPVPKASEVDLALEASELETPELPVITSVDPDSSVMGEVLPFRTRSAEVEFDSTPTWNEALVVVGAELQRIRQARGMSLDQIRFKTQIPVYQLQSLEAGQVDKLPEEIFVRGFLKRLCGQLGVEGQALLAQLPEPKQEQQEILAQWQQPGANVYGSQVVHLRSAHLYVGYATLLAGAAGGLALSFQETAQMAPSADSPQPRAQRSGAKATLNPAQRAAQLAFGSDVAEPEHSAPEINP